MDEINMNINDGHISNVHELFYGFINTKYGKCLAAVNAEKELCYISFFDENDQAKAVSNLSSFSPAAELKESNNEVKFLQEYFADQISNEKPLEIRLYGTNFQVDTWRQLLNIKKGTTVSYEDVAKAMGKPRAIRAVANAIAKNNVAYFIPCHRVISKNGNLNKYRWGKDRKLKMLEHERRQSVEI